MMTKVRMKVAKSELTFSTPTLAKIAVSAAKIAERTAQTCQDSAPSISSARRAAPAAARTRCLPRAAPWRRRARRCRRSSGASSRRSASCGLLRETSGRRSRHSATRWSRSSLSLVRSSRSCGDIIATGARLRCWRLRGRARRVTASGGAVMATSDFSVRARRGVISAFSTLVDPQLGHSTRPRSRLLVIGRGIGEPAFELVSFGADQIVPDHVSDCMQMGGLGHRLDDLEAPAVLERRDAAAGLADAATDRSPPSPRPARSPPSAMTLPQGSMTIEWPKVSRPLSWVPPCAAASTKQPFSTARARLSTCQWASPVWRVKAEGIARNERPPQPARDRARESAGRSRW